MSTKTIIRKSRICGKIVPAHCAGELPQG
jgi:hypothetical protein